MRAWLAGIALVGLAGTALATGPEMTVVVPGTDAVVGRIGRADGAFPFGVDATADRAACMMDSRAVSLPQLRAVLRDARRDRVGAYRAMLRLTRDCMERKGWRLTGCGGPGEEECPPSPPPASIPGVGPGVVEDGDEAER